MPVKIRLSKKGRKKLPYYHIVVADSRAPRDGKFVERIGLYNPQTNPATIELNFDRALDWLQKGAQPTDTCRSILSEKGVLLKKHLLEGVKKGAFNMEEAETRFGKWLSEKQAMAMAKADNISKQKADEAKKRLNAEVNVREAKAEEVAKKFKAQTEIAAKEAAEEAAEETMEETAEETVEDVVEEAAKEPSAKETVAEAAPAVNVTEKVVEESPETTDNKEAAEDSKTASAETVEKTAKKTEGKPAGDKAEEQAPARNKKSSEA